jgi:DNA-binding response OmpR family regulator
MRSVVFIGEQGSLAPYAEMLESHGFSVSFRAPFTEDPLPDGAAIAIVDLASAGEDPAVQSLLALTGTPDAIPVIALATALQVEAFEPVRDLEDFLRAGSPPEDLVARVRRAVWRHDRVDARNTLVAGDLVMDLANYTVQVGGRTVELTYKEYELLRYLATNRERVFSRETLLSNVWGYDFYGGARTVDVHVRRLRSKIEDRHRTFIETVRNVGYRFRAGS